MVTRASYCYEQRQFDSCVPILLLLHSDFVTSHDPFEFQRSISTGCASVAWVWGLPSVDNVHTLSSVMCVCVCVRALIEDVSCASIAGEPATLFLDVFVVKGLTIAFITFQASYKFQLGRTFLNVTEGIVAFIHIFLVRFFFTVHT